MIRRPSTRPFDRLRALGVLAASAALLAACGGKKIAGGPRSGEEGAQAPRAEERPWMTDLDAAIQRASAEKKDLLLNFTGSDWCVWCMKLKREVFDDEEFRSEGSKGFVWVEIDFPQNRASMGVEAQKKNQEWLEKFGVEGFPTIILADHKGRPYARTGYRPGGAKKYLEHLAEFGKVRALRDDELAKAAAAGGAERAAHLDRALEAVGESFALASYRDEIRQIIEADADDNAGLRSKYEERIELAEVRKVLDRVNREFDGENADEMLKLVDEAKSRFGSKLKPRLELGTFRVELLHAAGRAEEAAKAVDELLGAGGIPAETRVELGLRKAAMLRERDRLDDAVAVFDGLLADAGVEGEMRLRLRAQRADLLGDIGRTDEAVRALDELIADPAATDVRTILYGMRAGILVEAGRKLDAIRGLEKAEAALEDADAKAEIRGMLDELRAEGTEAPAGQEPPGGEG